MDTKIIEEKKYEGNIKDLLIIYGFGDGFLIGGHWHTKFYVKLG